MIALGALLDRRDDPGVAAAGERPVLGQGDLLALLRLPPHDPAPVAVDHVGAQVRRDAHDGAIVVIVLAVDEPDVLDLGLAEHLHAVVPALGGEVVEPPRPLDHEVLADDRGEPLAVAGVPGGLSLEEQVARLRHEPVRAEVSVVLGRLGGGGSHLRVALAHLPAVAPRVNGEVDHEDGEAAEEEQHDHGRARAAGPAAPEAATAASTEAAAPATAATEARRATTRLGERRVGEGERRQGAEEHDPGRARHRRPA